MDSPTAIDRSGLGRRARIATAAARAARTAQYLAQGVFWYDPRSQDTLALQLQRHAQVRPAELFLRYRSRAYTYGEANALINRHAHAYQALGVGKGDVVALMLENRPEFLWHFFGLQKLGAVASLINTNLPSHAALHAISICRPLRVTVGSEVWRSLSASVTEIARLAQGLDVDVDEEHPLQAEFVPFASRLASAGTDNPILREPPRLGDPAAYIYTSGTTGMPKAAVVRHDRFYRAGRIWATVAFDFRPGDLCYNCLPLYHSNALMLATGSVITAGAGMVLARRFSRTHFWRDVHDSGASSFIYIGEMCRYLLSAAPSPLDRAHRVRVISGNGLRADIWRQFQRRFGVERIAEFYGATEGNCVTINAGKTVGSCGLQLPGMVLVRWDPTSQALIRNAHGFLSPARVNEPGVLLCQIRSTRRFDGYTDREASERKVVRDAFVPGDAWFNTGDVLRRDRLYRLYFVDRLGDTFRWKGENVAAHEVEAVLGGFSAVAEASVYGVSIPRTEGRAGMASLVLHDAAELDPRALFEYVSERLPSYAQPLFVRLSSELKTTSTLKVSKTELQRDGFDPSAVSDALWFLDRTQASYRPLTPELHAAIVAGAVAL